MIQFALGPVEESVPALIIPLLSLPGVHETLSGGAAPHRACRIVTLNLDYLQRELLPTLAARHLNRNGANEYLFAVVRSGAASPVVYQSAAGLSADAFATADVTHNLFRISFDGLDSLLRLRLPGATKTEVREADGQKVQMGIVNNVRVVRRTGAGEQFISTVKREGEGAWRLLIKHRAGSLEAAVNKVRRRNLALSFGILLLLGLSMGLIVLASRRAQKLAAQQMEFVAGVSHELRTPLAVICSAAENLADGVVDNREQIKRYGSLIRDEGRRLGGMVEQVLEFAGAQSGKRSYELRSINARAVIGDALEALRVPLAEQGFYVEEDWPPRLPLIAADLAALSRALQNLLTNAMKYSAASRWITLRVAVVNHAELQFTVEDRGLGIPADELPHLGEAFYRGKAVVAAQIHGNGLGLSLVKQIAQAHGGRLSVESQVGQGSKFTLHIPLPLDAALQAQLADFTQKWEAR